MGALPASRLAVTLITDPSIEDIPLVLFLDWEKTEFDIETIIKKRPMISIVFFISYSVLPPLEVSVEDVFDSDGASELGDDFPE
jgi:hypothetical protein